MEEWTERWPKRPGVYLFYGYPMNKNVDGFPRLMLVTVEYNSPNFGTIYRTSRNTISPSTGAWGMWMSLFIPDLPKINEEKALKAATQLKVVKPLTFVD